MTTTFIIEHPTRGVLRDWDVDKFSFSWSGARNDPEKSHQFFTLEEACRVRELMPHGLRVRCEIRQSDEWAVVA